MEFRFWISQTLFYLYIYLMPFFFFFFSGIVHPLENSLDAPAFFFFKRDACLTVRPHWTVQILATLHAYPTLNNCLYVPFIVTSETRWRNQQSALERINFFITLILTHILFPFCSKTTIQIFPSQDNIFNSFCVFPIFGCFCINRLI